MLKYILMFLIRSYQLFLRGFIGPACRFYPSCSEYSYQAIQKYGAIKGSKLMIKRLLKCHPCHPGGVDPVP